LAQEVGGAMFAINGGYSSSINPPTL